MNQKYPKTPLLFIALFGFILVAASCSKSNSGGGGTVTTPATPIATLGLYEYQSGLNKRIFMPIAGIGTETVSYVSVFDTGSTGMTIDANGILPASMITTSGITVTGDSVVVNGITVTSKTSTIVYGDATSSTTEYGNLAYATVTLGDPSSTQITTKRIPFFMYYKIVDQTGKQLTAHSADVFGVGSGVSYTNSTIASPLSYFTTTNGGISGFKLATMNSLYFNGNGTLVPGLLTIGLIPSDLTTAGFVLHPLTYFTVGGYSDDIPATITYNGTVVSSAQILFDTGTPSITEIEDPKATGVGPLAPSSVVSITTNKGFTFQYIVGNSGNLTSIQNPNISGDTRTIFSLDFFVSNEYMVDYKDHEVGLKNN